MKQTTGASWGKPLSAMFYLESPGKSSIAIPAAAKHQVSEQGAGENIKLQENTIPMVPDTALWLEIGGGMINLFF